MRAVTLAYKRHECPHASTQYGRASERFLRATPRVPVRLDNGHNELVALGSYLVNAAAARSDFTRTELRTGRDPYLGQSAKINAEHFLAGGRQFGPFTSRNMRTPNSARCCRSCRGRRMQT